MQLSGSPLGSTAVLPTQYLPLRRSFSGYPVPRQSALLLSLGSRRGVEANALLVTAERTLERKGGHGIGGDTHGIVPRMSPVMTIQPALPVHTGVLERNQKNAIAGRANHLISPS